MANYSKQIFFRPTDGKVLNEDWESARKQIMDGNSPSPISNRGAVPVREEFADIKDGYVVNYQELLAKTPRPKMGIEIPNYQEHRISYDDTMKREKQGSKTIEVPSFTNEKYDHAHEEQRKTDDERKTKQLKKKMSKFNDKCLSDASVARDRNHKTKVEEKRFNEAKKKIKVFAAGVLLTIAVMGSVKGIDAAKDSFERADTRHAIAAMDEEEMARANQGYHVRDIVERNTRYIDHDPNKFFYENGAIANDILELPDELFEPALFTVYESMGPNRQNDVNDNIGNVIYNIGNRATIEENPTAYVETNGCRNFDEFLIRNGFVDENGMPNYELYENYGRGLLSAYNNAANLEYDRLINEHGGR